MSYKNFMQALELIKLNHSHCGFAVSQSDFNIKEVERILTLKLPNSELQVRIDKAIPYQWKDGGKTTIDTIFKIKVPKGTKIHVEDISSQGSIHLGGTQQIVISNAKNIQGIEVIEVTNIIREGK